MFEDNTACIAQIKGGYINEDRTKHISPKFYYTHELHKSDEIDVQQIHSSDNLVDLFTKSLPTSTFKKLICKIGMRQLKDIEMSEIMLSEIDVQHIRSSDNLIYLFTKSLLTSTFNKLIYKIGMRQPKDIGMRGSMLLT